MREWLERVVVVLDAAAENPAAIETAARLAARWQVPLHGVFVEDAELIDLADLPFAAEITLAGRDKLTRRQLEDHLHAFAERARRQLAAAAAHQRVAHSFAVARGPIAVLLLGERDFVVASAATRPIGGHFRVRSHWWARVAKTRHPLLLVRRQWQTGGSVVTVLRRRDRLSARLLEIAAEIAGLGNAAMTVFADPEPVAVGRLEDWVKTALTEHSLDLATEETPREPLALRRRAVELDCRLIALCADMARPADLEELVEHAACDVLVIGEGAEDPRA